MKFSVHTSNEKLNKFINEVFIRERECLTDEEVDKELQIGNEVVNLFKNDLEELKNNYIDEIKERKKDNTELYNIKSLKRKKLNDEFFHFIDTKRNDKFIHMRRQRLSGKYKYFPNIINRNFFKNQD